MGMGLLWILGYLLFVAIGTPTLYPAPYSSEILNGIVTFLPPVPLREFMAPALSSLMIPRDVEN